MATISGVIGLSNLPTDFSPHMYGFDYYQTNPVPEFYGAMTMGSQSRVAPSPVRVLTTVQTDGALTITIDSPVLLDPDTETHLPGHKWAVANPVTVSNTVTQGAITAAISRLMNRFSKIFRGVN